jgi:NAD(P)H dehydrogenase (quinone)
MTARIAVIYYSSGGNVHQLASAVADGARGAGADVRLRRAGEGYFDGREEIPLASLDDLTWADGFAFGTPARYGLPAWPLKRFFDQTGDLWEAGALSDKVATAFVSSDFDHGGQESTILAIYNVIHHWGSLIVGPGYTDAVTEAAGGNPYGASATGSPTADELAAARYLGRRLAEFAGPVATVRAGRETLAA